MTKRTPKKKYKKSNTQNDQVSENEQSVSALLPNPQPIEQGATCSTDTATPAHTDTVSEISNDTTDVITVGNETHTINDVTDGLLG